MNTDLPGIIVTGASGFIGRHFLEAARGKYRLFCLARRTQKEAGVPLDDNLRWTQVDIANWDTLRDVVRCVKDHGGADFVLHLAGYYDFSNKENPAYERTNVTGTRNVLKLAKLIGTKRFIFSSSLAACEFPAPGKQINEESKADGQIPYAISKFKGEELIKENAEWFPSAIVRLAAIYSDWCEYPPLYVFLSTWLSKNWNARILGGKGESAVTYLHINDLTKFLLLIIEKSNSLPRTCTLNASPNSSTSHLDLFNAATRYSSGQEIKPIKMSKILVAPGIYVRYFLGKLIKREPFEVPWMIKYIDKKLNVNSSQTHKVLDWKPTGRYDLTRRLLFMIENLKTHPDMWKLKNELAMQRIARRSNLIIYNLLIEYRTPIISKIQNFIQLPENTNRFKFYQEMKPEVLRWFLTLIFQIVATTVRSKDRTLMRNYARIIAQRRFLEGCKCEQLCDSLSMIGKIICDEILSTSDFNDMESSLYDYINLSFQLANDEVEETYESLGQQSQAYLINLRQMELPAESDQLERIVSQLDDICSNVFEEELHKEIMPN